MRGFVTQDYLSTLSPRFPVVSVSGDKYVSGQDQGRQITTDGMGGVFPIPVSRGPQTSVDVTHRIRQILANQ